jgi:outer membrane cobalamin receptor
VKLGFEGGVRTNIMEIVDMHLGVRYRNTDGDPFYVYHIPDPNHVPQGYDPILNTFELVYDETQTVTVMADVRVKMRNSLTADLGFAYNSCKPTVEEYAWYRPTTEGKLKVTYDFDDKLSFNTTFLYQGGRYAKVWDGIIDWQNFNFKAEKLKDVFDLSLGADYKVNEQITAFALLDNVAHQKYQMFYNYPVTGIQFFAGVKLTF